ncbi:MAG: hypothetical protein L0387_44040 [Acidobacteria bacterium]|nr:hypothetical protein [Acidobacteriota bacterium]MCI0718878.1 hypothetical protein [Acidobacteriota bacterium]
MNKEETSEKVRIWFQTTIQKMWPVAEGSLSLRKSPCIRENCQACAKGKGHLSYVLYGREGKRRFSIYVPEALVPEIEKALANGRRLQQVMNEAGVRYVHALKRERRLKSIK